MEHDGDLKGGPWGLVAPSIHEPAEGGSAQHDLFEESGLLVVPPRDRSISHGTDARAGERSLFEDAWAPNPTSPQCDQFLAQLLMAQEVEGRRMGRELHDSTGQLLLALRLGIAHLKQVGDGAARDEIVDELSETARQIDQEIRAFAYLHYPAELGKGGLIAALNTLARGFANRTGLRVTFDSICGRVVANGAGSIALLRIAQEALMNVHRHAHASTVRMLLVERDDKLELSVQDDGQGMPPAKSVAATQGVGLQGMRHRIERLGGQFSIRRLKHGTKLVARLAMGRGNRRD